MRFIFIEPFDTEQWNGEIARNSKDLSLTHTTMLHLAETLSNKNHSVDFVSFNNNIIETNYNNVNYINYSNFQISEYDFIITSNNLIGLQILFKIPSYSKIIILTTSELYNYDILSYISITNIVLAYFHPFEKQNIINSQLFLKKFRYIYLFNCNDIIDTVIYEADYTEELQTHLLNVSNTQSIPENHISYLYNLKKNGFEPKVIYDIGACVLHWTNVAKLIWPNAKILLFDAFEPAEFLYKDYDYYIGVLSNTDNNIVKFYQNDFLPGGNSYYREIGCEDGKYFPENNYIEKFTKTLDTIVKEKGFPLPDFIKIDVQGCEIDIINGGINTINNAERMVVELQHTEYNKGALLANESIHLIEELGWNCIDPLFQNNGCDGDYGFVNNKILK